MTTTEEIQDMLYKEYGGLTDTLLALCKDKVISRKEFRTIWHWLAMETMAERIEELLNSRM